VLELGLGNVIFVMAASLTLYLLFEWPFRNLLTLALLKKCSYEDSLHLAYLRRKLSASGSPKDFIGNFTPDRQAGIGIGGKGVLMVDSRDGSFIAADRSKLDSRDSFD